MASLLTIYSMLFKQFKGKDISKIDKTKTDVTEVIERDKQKILYIFLGEEYTSQKKLSAFDVYLKDYNSVPELRKYLFPGSQAIEASSIQRSPHNFVGIFSNMNHKFGYFSSDDQNAQALFIELYKLCEYQAKFVEDSVWVNAGLIAYNMLVLFGTSAEYAEGAPQDAVKDAEETIKALDVFIKTHMSSTKTPLHDLFLSELSQYNIENPEFDLSAWKKKLPILGSELVRNFTDIPIITKFISQEKADGRGDALDIDENNIPSNRKAFDNILDRAVYKSDQYPDLASVYKFYRVPKNIYDKTIELMDNGTLQTDSSGKKLLPKRQDNIPEIKVEIDSGKYYLVKLPSDNYRALILGHITHCCQSIGNEAEKYVIQGVNLSNHGFYAFIKIGESATDFEEIDWDNFETDREGRKTGNKIIGQSLVWRGTDGALVLDSLEVLESFRKEMDIETTLTKLGVSLSQIDPSIERVTIGLGGQTSEVLKANNFESTETLTPEYQREGEEGYDATKQCEVYVSSSLREARNRLESITNRKHEHIITLAQAEQLELLGDQSLRLLSAHYNYEEWTNIGIVKSATNTKELHSLYEKLGALQVSNPTKYELLLLNPQVRKILTKGLITIKDLLELNEEQIEDIIYCPPQVIYEFGFKSMEILEETTELSQRKILKLIVKHLYQEEADYADTMSIDLVYKLIEPYVIESYKAKYIKPSELKDLTLEQIELLITHRTLDAVKNGYFNLTEIKDLTAEQIKAITSHEALEYYRGNLISCSDLIGLDTGHIIELTSRKHKGLYFKKYISVLELKDLPLEQIKILTSNYSLALYQEEYKVADLVRETSEQTLKNILRLVAKVIAHEEESSISYVDTLEVEVVSRLLRYEYIEAYTKGYAKPSDLVSKSDQICKKLLSSNALYLYKISETTVCDLIDYSDEYIDFFINPQTMYAFRNKHVKFFDIKDLEIERINILISPQALQLYEDEYITLANLKEVTIAQAKSLVSWWATKAYKTGKVTYENLKDLSAEQIENVTLIPKVLELYKAGYAIVSDFKDVPREQLEILSSPRILKLYELGFKVSDLVADTEFNVDQKALLCVLERFANTYSLEKRKSFVSSLNTETLYSMISEYAIKAYEEKVLFVDDFMELDQVKLDSLASYNAIKIYKNKYTKFVDLKEWPQEYIKIFVSYDALKAYELYGVKPEDYRSLSVDQTRILLRPEALKVCRDEKIEPNEFKEDSIDKLQMYFYQANEVYKVGTKLAELRPFDIESLKILLSPSLLYIYKSTEIRIADFNGANLKQIQQLTTYDVMRAYESGYVTPSDLIGLSEDQVRKMCSWEMIDKYQTKLITASDLIGASVEEMKYLTSHDMMLKYQYSKVNPSDFIGLSVEEIKDLTSSEMLELYENCNVRPSDFRGKTKEQLDVLTSYEVSILYKFYDMTPSELEGLSLEQATSLMSREFENSYRSGYIHPRDLLDLTDVQRTSVTSYRAIEAYKSGHITVSDVKATDPDLTGTLLTHELLAIYKSGDIKPFHFNGFTIEMVSKITTPQAMDLYRKGFARVEDFKGCDLEKADILLSCQAIMAYTAGVTTFNVLKEMSIEEMYCTISYQKIFGFTASDIGSVFEEDGTTDSVYQEEDTQLLGGA